MYNDLINLIYHLLIKPVGEILIKEENLEKLRAIRTEIIELMREELKII